MSADRSALGVVLTGGDHAQVHFAFSFAVSAAALDRPVTLLAAAAGLHAICRDWSRLGNAAQDSVLIAAGLAGLDGLRDAAHELGIRLMACEASVRAASMRPADFLENVRIVGIPTFLAEIGDGQIVSF